MTAPTSGAIGTPYGVPGNWQAGHHTGVDYPVPTGTRVNATAASTIKHVGTYGGWGSAYGLQVIGECIVGGIRYQWIDAHLSKALTKKGDHVAAGQVVALSGYSGNVRPRGPRGRHLHFEVRRWPFRYGDDVNPAVLIQHKPGPVDKMNPDNYGPGHVGSHITEYGKRLVALGHGDHYRQGPGPVWGEADRLNTRDFQRAQGWVGDDANGLPGPETLRRVFKK